MHHVLFETATQLRSNHLVLGLEMATIKYSLINNEYIFRLTTGTRPL